MATTQTVQRTANETPSAKRQCKGRRCTSPPKPAQTRKRGRKAKSTQTTSKRKGKPIEPPGKPLLLEMPIEIVVEIIDQIGAVRDVFAFSQTCTIFRSMLHKDNHAFWKSRLPDLPPVEVRNLAKLTPYQKVRALQARAYQYCNFCLGTVDQPSFYRHFLRRNMYSSNPKQRAYEAACDECFDTYFVNENQLDYILGEFDRYDLNEMGSMQRRSWCGLRQFYLLSEVVRKHDKMYPGKTWLDSVTETQRFRELLDTREREKRLCARQEELKS